MPVVYDESDYREEKDFTMKTLYETGGVECLHVLETDLKGFFLEVETSSHFVFLMYVRIMNKSLPCYLRDRLEDIRMDRERNVSYSIVLGTFISVNSDAFCREHHIGYIDKQGNYWLDFCQFHHRRTGFFPKIKNRYPMKYGGPRNKVPRPW